MKDDALSPERVRELFAYDPEGHLTWRLAGKGRCIGRRAGCETGVGYIVIRFDGVLYYAHRLVWMWHHGTIPQFLDHIDRNRGNNRIANLRPATAQENTRNRTKADGTHSKWNGVTWCKKARKWKAQMRFNGRNTYLGNYEEEADAAMAFNEAAYEHFGEFANLNCANQTVVC